MAANIKDCPSAVYGSYSSLNNQYGTAKANDTKTSETSSTEKPATAKDVLARLNSKFPNANIYVGDYKENTTFGSGKDGNFMLSPTLLSKMAHDPKLLAGIEANMEAVLKGQANGLFQDTKDRVVLSAGTWMDADGNMGMYSFSIGRQHVKKFGRMNAGTKKTSTGIDIKDIIGKAKARKAEEAKAAEKRAEKKAQSEKEEMLRSIQWEEKQELLERMQGSGQSAAALPANRLDIKI